MREIKTVNEQCKRVLLHMMARYGPLSPLQIWTDLTRRKATVLQRWSGENSQRVMIRLYLCDLVDDGRATRVSRGVYASTSALRKLEEMTDDSHDIHQLAGRHAPVTMLGARSIARLVEDLDAAHRLLCDRLAQAIKTRLNLRELPRVLVRRACDDAALVVIFENGARLSLSLSPLREIEEMCASLRWTLNKQLAALQAEGSA